MCRTAVRGGSNPPMGLQYAALKHWIQTADAYSSGWGSSGKNPTLPGWRQLLLVHPHWLSSCLLVVEHADETRILGTTSAPSRPAPAAGCCMLPAAPAVSAPSWQAYLEVTGAISHHTQCASALPQLRFLSHFRASGASSVCLGHSATLNMQVEVEAWLPPRYPQMRQLPAAAARFGGRPRPNSMQLPTKKNTPTS